MNKLQHQARKRFGQNFLQDDHYIDQIIQAIQVSPEDKIVEIGPGQGALTWKLLATGCELTAIEIDRDLSLYLKSENPKLNLIEKDALALDFTSLLQTENNDRHTKVVGNLPYNISTPLIFHLLKFENQIDSMFFMLQKEVVDRMVSGANSKTYGRLSVTVQYHCEVTPIFDIPPTAFKPAPKVVSTLVSLKPRKLPIQAKDIKHFHQVVSSAFMHRRKTLRNAFKKQWPDKISVIPTEILDARADQLEVADYVSLSNLLCQN